MFHNPVVNTSFDGQVYDMNLGGPAVCFNSFALSSAIENIPSEAKRVQIHISEEVSLIDHTSLEILHHLQHEFHLTGRGEVDFIGMDLMHGITDHESSFRLGNRYPTISKD